MTEETIFADALAKKDPAARCAYLDAACGGDAALRQRVEALLASHEQAGSFLGQPLPERLAEPRATPEEATQGETPPMAEDVEEALAFLTPSDQPGALGRLGHYEIVEVVGRGGMGVVLRAFDEKLHRVVAIKVMATELAGSGTARKRFIREAQAAAAVSHDHVVTIHGVEEEHRPPYLVMQFIDGVSLQQKLDQVGPLGLKEILRIGLQTAEGLAAAHKQGLVHRDIKPANILLENGVERVKITDFGLARAAADASLTQEGAVAGTPQDMSPEQAHGETVDQRSDLFSLGCVLYALCTGRPPFRARGTMAVLKRVCEATPPPIHEVNAEIPAWLVALIAKLHAKDPAERYQSAAEVAEVLGRHLAHLQQPSGVAQPVESKTPDGAAAGRRRWGVAAAVLLVVGVLGLIVALSLTSWWRGVWHASAPSQLEPQATNPEEEKVRGSAVPPPVVEPAKPPFVVLARASQGDQAFATLAEAVAGAAYGDTIEIRGDGPFVSAAIPPIQGKRLTIRAGASARPVLLWVEESMSSTLDPRGTRGGFLSSDVDLILEGLEFGVSPASSHDPRSGGLSHVVSRLPNGSLLVANCRFRTSPAGILSPQPIYAINSACVVRNCEFFGKGISVMNFTRSGNQGSPLAIIDNSVLACGSYGLGWSNANSGITCRLLVTRTRQRGHRGRTLHDRRGPRRLVRRRWNPWSRVRNTTATGQVAPSSERVSRRPASWI